ncbi:MAG: dienelactone hydrolase family protein [Deltaproteobacteria bacterium]|nr:dienelactone hydrolase family protein [Deltaproteobacteria bacterium]
MKRPVTHLVVMLHGYGADAQSFARISRMVTSRLSTAEVLIPDAFDPYEGGPTGRQWFSRQGNLEAERLERVARAGQRLSAWLDAELQRRGLLADRLVVVGFSQGGMLAGWLALNRGQRPAAVVVMSGQVVQSAAAVPTRGRAAPVLVVHGEADRVIPVDVVDPGVQLLESAGLKVTRRVLPGLGHGVQVDELNEIAMFLAEATGER